VEVSLNGLTIEIHIAYMVFVNPPNFVILKKFQFFLKIILKITLEKEIPKFSQCFDSKNNKNYF
jgi:hypothetical protein